MVDVTQLITLLAPAGVIFLTQLLKNVIASRFAPVIVFILGGITAVAQQGTSPDPSWIDGLVTVGWVSGVATFIYDLVKKLFEKEQPAQPAQPAQPTQPTQP